MKCLKFILKNDLIFFDILVEKKMRRINVDLENINIKK